MILTCHVILQDHLIKGSCDLGRNVSYHPAKFGGHRHSDSGDMILVCRVILT